MRWMRRQRLAGSLLLGLAGFAEPRVALADAVQLTVSVDGREASNSYNSVQDAFGIIGSQTVAGYFSSFFRTYTDTSAASAQISYLDVGIRYSFDAGSNTVNLVIPATGFSRSFTSDNRQNSNRLLRDFLRDNGDLVLRDIEKYRIQNSPSSPVAGNPSSLQSTLVDQNFSSLTSDAPSVGSGGSKAGSGSTQIGFEGGTFSTGRLNGSNYTLPLSYSMLVGSKGNELRFSLPITYTILGGSQIYSGSFGATYRQALTGNLSLQSGFSYGVVYSEDLLQLVQLASATVGLSYRIELGGATVTPAILLGQVNSLGLKISDYSFDPNIDSYTVKVGQIVENDVKMFGYPVRVQAFAAYTHLLGEDFFVQGYTDFGVNFGLLAPSGNRFTRRIRAGLIVTASETYSAARLSFGYAF
ncbi:MAG: hypothetical protein Q7J29_11540 [Stagnimonas sp.]|nr:hypothetical protein [Stagnimonas sp.]